MFWSFRVPRTRKHGVLLEVVAAPDLHHSFLPLFPSLQVDPSGHVVGYESDFQSRKHFASPKRRYQVGFFLDSANVIWQPYAGGRPMICWVSTG